jgi:heme A synthase
VTTTSQRRFAIFAWGVLAYNLLVILWGAFVRATGSGAGCGKHWPLCNGEVVPRGRTLQTIIEYTHRTTSAAAGLVVIVLLIWAFRAFSKGHAVRLGAVLSMIFIVTEGLVGAGLVLLEHVARNVSMARAYSLSLHLLNTLTLVACLALTAWWASGGAPVRLRGRDTGLALTSIGVLLLLGVSGALAALGDTLFPAATLAQGIQQDFSPAAHLFVRLRVLHPFIAAAAGAWLLFWSVSLAVRGEDANYAWTVAAMVIAQILAGVVNLILLAPVWMQIVHLLFADLLWISLVFLCARRLAVRS